MKLEKDHEQRDDEFPSSPRIRVSHLKEKQKPAKQKNPQSFKM